MKESKFAFLFDLSAKDRDALAHGTVPDQLRRDAEIMQRVLDPKRVSSNVHSTHKEDT